MALRSGLDTVAIVTSGTYTETYVSSTGSQNIANLFASWGLLEDAPEGVADEPTRGLMRMGLNLTLD